MIRLRLFNRQDPSRQIDSRVLDDGEMTIGRGIKADWQVPDPERDMSRLHLTVAVRGGMLTVRDTSANGVFIGNPRTRLDHDRPVPVSRGESIVFGPYLIVVEEDAGAVVDDAPILDDPFTGSGDDAAPPPARPRDPFGSALRPDPIKLDEEPGDGVDAWERRRTFQAGDWDPVAPHRRPDHAELIGSPQNWTEPPPPPAREHGMGFDAPFVSPILRQPEPTVAGDLAIPSDWDSLPLTPAPPTPAPVPHDEAPIAPPPVAIDDPILPPPVPVADPVPPAPAPIPAPTPPPLPSAAPAVATAGDDALFDSFCAGARLSPNAFAGEDRALLMERLGAVYRQAILGIADLMTERTALKNDFRMVRTTIRPEGNNPFKWVPPQRIAIELLRSDDGSGYVTGERALSEALHDVKAHMLCVLAGMRGAIGATFDLLSPAEIEARTANRGFVMPGQRSAAAWSDYVDQFAAQRREADDSVDGPINRAFRDAYEDQLRQIDAPGRGR
jgi:type VI secretion system FHA domain protein